MDCVPEVVDSTVDTLILMPKIFYPYTGSQIHAVAKSVYLPACVQTVEIQESNIGI